MDEDEETCPHESVYTCSQACSRPCRKGCGTVTDVRSARYMTHLHCVDCEGTRCHGPWYPARREPATTFRRDR